jgi:hypothetical protein
LRFTKRRKAKDRRDGCGFLVLTCVFTCFFLVLNSALVAKMYPPLAQLGPDLLSHPRVKQIMMFVGPVVLVFVEWWLVDLVVEVLTPRRKTR